MSGHGWIGRIVSAAIVILAAIGLFSLIGGPVASVFRPLLFEDRFIHKATAPDGQAVAQIEQTRGWGGTASTTRVLLKLAGRDPWTVYESRDSATVPTIAWLDKDTLVIGLTCARFDHISDPDDWPRAGSRAPRRAVRFFYTDPKCILPPETPATPPKAANP